MAIVNEAVAPYSITLGRCDEDSYPHAESQL